MAFTISFTGNDMADITRQINAFLGAPAAPAKLATPKEEWVEPVKTAPAVVEDTAPEPEPVVEDTAPKALTYDDLASAVLRLSVAKGKPAVLDLFAKYGAQKKASEIAEDKWADVMADINTLLGE